VVEEPLHEIFVAVFQARRYVTIEDVQRNAPNHLPVAKSLCLAFLEKALVLFQQRRFSEVFRLAKENPALAINPMDVMNTQAVA
jgi:hypothetical protein